MRAPGSALGEKVSATDAESLRRAFAEQPELLIYKHPPTCWAGVRAAREVDALLDADPQLEVWHVVVTQERALSNLIAELFELRHESPQALLLRYGVLVWSGSHHNVNASRIAEARGALPDGEGGGADSRARRMDTEGAES